MRKFTVVLIVALMISISAFAQIGTSVLSNQSGGDVAIGAVLVHDSSADKAFKTTTSSRDPTFVGIAFRAITAGNTGLIFMQGSYTETILVTGAVARGDFLVTSTTASRAASGGTADSSGAFAIAVTANGGGTGTVSAVLMVTAGAASTFGSGLTLPDDQNIIFGSTPSAGDFHLGYDEATDNRLEWKDGASGNNMMHLTDAGATGNLVVTGSFTSVAGTFTGELAADGTSLTTDATTFGLLDVVPTTVNFAGNAAVDIGKTGLATTVKGTLNVDEAVTFDTTLAVAGVLTADVEFAADGASITTNDLTFGLLDIVPTKINFGGIAAIDLSGTGLVTTIKGTLNVDEAVTFDTTLSVTGDVTAVADLAINGGDLTFDDTTINIGVGDPTTINLGDSGATTQLLGTLGVGIARTEGTLHAHTGSAGSVTASTNADDLIVENNSNAGISILAVNGGDASLFFGEDTNGTAGRIIYDGNPTNDLLIQTNNSGSDIAFYTDVLTLALRLTDSQEVIAETGGYQFKEGSAPSPATAVAAIYSTTIDTLRYIDGAGGDHLIHGDAHSDMWFHNHSTSTLTISTQLVFTKITQFANVENEDSSGNVVSDPTTDNDITIGTNGAGEYAIAYGFSGNVAGGASKNILIQPGIVLATALDITNVTDNTVSPIVITSTAHGLLNGDMLTIVNVLVNTAANGDFMVANKAANTFEIVKLDGTATTGNGDYDEGTPTGDVTIKYPGNMVSHFTASGSDTNSVGKSEGHDLVATDAVSLYTMNLDGTQDLQVFATNLGILRIGD